jgi:hypothetical protein
MKLSQSDSPYYRIKENKNPRDHLSGCRTLTKLSTFMVKTLTEGLEGTCLNIRKDKCERPTADIILKASPLTGRGQAGLPSPSV